METTVRDITDFTVSLLDDLDCADFPALTVLDLLGPRVDSVISNYTRMDPRAGLVDIVAPGCVENLPVIRDWCRITPVNPWFVLMNHGDRVPLSGATTAGGRAAWSRDPLQHLISSVTGCDQLAALPLTAGPGEICGLSFARSGRDFTHDELDFLATVQPLLQAVARHADRIARWGRQLSDPSRGLTACRDAGLTTRELDVLRLMAEGLTAVSVARRLGCAPRTAEKHAANVYRKFGVNDRVSAVLEAQRRGLLPVPAPHDAP
jgi:DNA-binding CsgD family transcriptional regulator